MLIQEPDPKIKTVEDLEFTFSGGYVYTITLDEAAGDAVQMPTVDMMVLHFAEKRSPVDPEATEPAGTMTVNMRNVLMLNRRKRMVTELTSAQKMEWAKTLQELSGTVQ